jgi:hypothetical protein
MESQVTLDAVVAASQDVVARRIEDELILVPLVGDIGDRDDELFSLNDTGMVIWDCLDGQRTLRDVAAELAERFDDPGGEIEADVIGLVSELARRRMVVVREA